MSAAAVLRDLAAAGVTLYPEGQVLRFRAPAGAYTPALRAAVARHRAELLAALAAPANDPAPVAYPRAPWAPLRPGDRPATGEEIAALMLKPVATWAAQDAVCWAAARAGQALPGEVWVPVTT